VRRESALVAELARQVGLLEQRVMAAVDDDPQTFLTALFTARHELLTIHTMASQGGEIYRRAIILGRRFTTKDRAHPLARAGHSAARDADPLVDPAALGEAPGLMVSTVYRCSGLPR